MRWAGADEWVARRSNQYFPVYVKRLDSPTVDADPEPIIDDVVQLRPEVTKQRRESIDAVASILRESIESQKSIPSVLNFSYVSWETEADLEDEGAEPDEATLFGIQMIKMFEFSIQTRDGKKIDIFPNEITTNFNQGRRAFYLRGKINDGTDDIGTFDRTIRAIQKDDGSIVLYVDHDSLFIRDSYQGQGIGTAFNSELERIYRELGVSYIQTNASSSGGHYRTKYIGATHWPRSGFDWSDDFNKQEYIRVLDYLMEPDPESEEMMPSSMAYVEGLSSGPPPVGTDRFDIAYFSSVEEWENFVEAMEQARGESFDDENRIVAGDLVRWDGADDYFAGGEFLFVLIKRLMED
jgi:GNAT superfamily N-acetyltransferase